MEKKRRLIKDDWLGHLKIYVGMVGGFELGLERMVVVCDDGNDDRCIVTSDSDVRSEFTYHWVSRSTKAIHAHNNNCSVQTAVCTT